MEMERYVFHFWFLCCKGYVIQDIPSDLAESSEYQLIFFQDGEPMNSQFKTSSPRRTLFLK